MFARLNNGIGEVLSSYNISSTTDVFEEVVLSQLASVQTKPKKCHFHFLDSENSERMFFSIEGITDEDAAKFLSFFKDSCGDSSAVNYKDKNEYIFEVSTAVIVSEVLPKFKEAMKKNSNETIYNYRRQSEINRFSFASPVRYTPADLVHNPHVRKSRDNSDTNNNASPRPN